MTGRAFTEDRHIEVSHHILTIFQPFSVQEEINNEDHLCNHRSTLHELFQWYVLDLCLS
jgi:hypothetical protein